MKVAVFSTKSYDRRFLIAANEIDQHELVFFEPPLTPETAVLASGFPAVCVFVNDRLEAIALNTLARSGVRLIALRCAGFNNVDLIAATKLGLTVLRVPAYSPHTVAEHAIALILTLNRKTHRAYARVREGNFALNGLLGFELRGRTVGVVGTGKIGAIAARILHGFGCQLLAHDVVPNPECEALGVNYVSLPELFSVSDIITLHCPLLPATYHLINSEAICQMKPGVMLINTSRGALIDTRTAIEGLKSGRIGYLGLDVYEQEEELFFEDLSDSVIQDDIFGRLLTFPNVIITGHQAFFTETALTNIAETTIANITDFERGHSCPNQVTDERIVKSTKASVS